MIAKRQAEPLRSWRGQRRFFLRLWVGVLVVLCVERAAAEEFCDDDAGLVCVVVDQKADSISFAARNKFPALPVTFQIEIEVQNLDVAREVRMPVVVAGGSDRTVMVYNMRANSAWRYDYTFNWTMGDHTAVHDSETLYQLPFAPDTEFQLSQSCNGSFSHRGGQANALDFSMPEGTPIHAARDGTVVRVREDSTKGGAAASFKWDANEVIIQHSDRSLGHYLHLQPNGSVVGIGDAVKAGDLLGYSGNTGHSSGPHLHFEVTVGAAKNASASQPILLHTQNGPIRCPKRGALLRSIGLP